MSNINDLTGLGQPIAAAIADPGAGTELTIAVPAGQIWLILAIQFTFTASATVATRNVRLLYQQGSNFSFFYPNMQITAGQSPRYDFMRDVETYSVAAGVKPFANQNFKLPAFPLDGDRSGRIFTTTSNIQAGDAFTATKIFYQRWIK